MPAQSIQAPIMVTATQRHTEVNTAHGKSIKAMGLLFVGGVLSIVSSVYSIQKAGVFPAPIMDDLEDMWHQHRVEEEIDEAAGPLVQTLSRDVIAAETADAKQRSQLAATGEAAPNATRKVASNAETKIEDGDTPDQVNTDEEMLPTIVLTGNPNVPPMRERQFQYNSTWNVNTTVTPIIVSGCCGLGHRLANTIRTLAYGLRYQRPVRVLWSQAPWDALIEDTPFIQAASPNDDGEKYNNDSPKNWDGVNRPRPMQGTDQLLWSVYHTYKLNKRTMFTNIECGTVVDHMMENLTPLVRNKLIPVQRKTQPLHLCAHFRLGNNETGDWQIKSWRHVHSPSQMMNMTLQAMVKFTQEDGNAQKREDGVSVFVAGDDPNIQSWFRDHAPDGWNVIMSDVEESDGADAGADRLPESGVWFGDFKSATSNILTQEQKNDKMADAMADSILLGNCTALYVPTYSSFTVLPIMMAHKRGASMFLRERDEFLPFEDDPYRKLLKKRRSRRALENRKEEK